ncbi:hypothetical protein FRC04_005565 [Tulasnella sp. 424]|nr:hypothetical protein FRC04_005565 [Tulasnella sp. 424]KAG8961141.1 hypothetical protein FRC05_006374 [Tulasnella sp. 425]
MNPSTADPESLTIRSHAVAELAINTFGGFFPSAEFLDGYTGRTSSNPTERLESIAQERQQLLRRHAKQKEALLEQQSKELHRAQAFFNGAADPENFGYEGKQIPKPVHDARALAPANARNEVNLLLASQGRLLAKVVEVQRQDLTRLKNLKENTQAEISSTENSLRSGSRFPASEWEFDLLINQVNPQHGTQVAQYLSTDDEAARKVIFSLAHQSGRQWTEAATMPLRTLYSQSAEFRAKVLDTLKPKDSATTHGHRTTVTSLMIP